MKKRVIIVIVWITAVTGICVVLIRGCRVSGPMREAELVGKYTDLAEENKYYLELRPDNTYFQRIVRADGQEVTNVGHWRLDSSEGKPVLKVTDFKSVWMGKLESSTVYHASIKKTLSGRCELWFAEWLVLSYSSALPQEEDANE
jgi:hypothetical protein